MTMTPTYQVHYLDPRDGWMPTNLGRFADPDEARAAALQWREGYARTHGGHRPPTRITIAPTPTPTPITTEP